MPYAGGPEALPERRHVAGHGRELLSRYRGPGRGRAAPDHGRGSMAEHYQRPGWFTTNVFNPIVAGLTRLGIGVYGSRVLEVRGRRSGEWRSTPVNLLRYEGEEYLVAPRGQTQWVKNLR